MNYWVKLYLVSKWIFLIGLGPFLYDLMLRIFLMICIFIFNLEAYKISRIFINSFYDHYSWIGLPILLFILIKKQSKQSFTHIKEFSIKFKTGVYLVFVGHIGLSLFILTFMHVQMFDHVFYPIYMLWMSCFYIIGFKMIKEFLELEDKKNKN